MPTAPHTRHNWQIARKRDGYICKRCRAWVPASLVDKADRLGHSRDLPLEDVLTLLHAQQPRVAP